MCDEMRGLLPLWGRCPKRGREEMRWKRKERGGRRRIKRAE
jgi:hypothetical protein